MKKIAVIATLVVGMVLGCVIMTVAPPAISWADDGALNPAAPSTPDKCVCAPWEDETNSMGLRHCYCGELDCVRLRDSAWDGFGTVTCK